MPSPLPGMDLFLEQPAFWSSFHSRFIVALADAIEAGLTPAYYVEVEARTYLDEDNDSLLIGIPDAVVVTQGASAETSTESNGSPVAVQVRPQAVQVPLPESVTERYLEIRDLAWGVVITALELLSPKNTRPGPGRLAYEQKRRRILGSLTHLVELDLLRGGEPMAVLGPVVPTAYRVLVSVSNHRPRADLYGIPLQELLPAIPIPLKAGDPPVVVALQAVFDGVYDRGRYQNRIDYSQPPPPPALAQGEQTWLQAQLAAPRPS
jgi:hypothetical protein